MKLNFLQKIGFRAKNRTVESPGFNEDDELDIKRQTLFQKAKEKNANGDCNGAILDLNRVINNYPESSSQAEVYLYRGKINSHQLRSYAKALADLDTSIRLKPNVVEAYRVRGDIKKEMGDFKGAMKDLNYGIKLNKANAGLYLSRGMLHDVMRKRTKSIKDLKRAVKLNVSNGDDAFNAEFHLLIGMMSSTIKNYKDAIESLTTAIECNPQLSKAYNERADTWEFLGFEEEAIQDRDRAEELMA